MKFQIKLAYCWHRVNRCSFPGYHRCFFSGKRNSQPVNLLPLHIIALSSFRSLQKFLIAASHRNLGDVSVLVCLAHKLLPYHLAYNQTGELLLGWIPPLASQLTTFSGCLSPPKNRLIHITHPSAIENSTSRLTCLVHLEPGSNSFSSLIFLKK